MALGHEGEPLRDPSQHLELPPREALIPLLGGGEVGEEAARLQAGQGADPLRQGDARLGEQAVPVEPGLHLEVDRHHRARR